MAQSYLLSSEAVSEGHPDKLADWISDALLDQILTWDKQARVACEVLACAQVLVIGGEITSRASYDIPSALESLDNTIGCPSVQLHRIPWKNYIRQQSPEISQSVSQGGAGDQGIFFGYACQDTQAYLPFPLFYGYKLLEYYKTLRQQREFSFLLADAKVQLIVEYQAGVPVHIHQVVLSCHHTTAVDLVTLKEVIAWQLFQKILEPTGLLSSRTQYLVNPSGSFLIGGLQADTGLTGRKIVVDSYGGFAPHGGGAFSGKDPTKVDRCAPYMARYIAKNLVASNLFKHCTVHLAYAIGKANPLQFHLSGHLENTALLHKLQKKLLQHLDLTPQGIIHFFQLQHTNYSALCQYGHFNKAQAPWEQTDLVPYLEQWV